VHVERGREKKLGNYSRKWRSCQRLKRQGGGLRDNEPTRAYRTLVNARKKKENLSGKGDWTVQESARCGKNKSNKGAGKDCQELLITRTGEEKQEKEMTVVQRRFTGQKEIGRGGKDWRTVGKGTQPKGGSGRNGNHLPEQGGRRDLKRESL